MSNRIDYTTIEVPTVLRDRIARHRLHGRQPYYEVVEEALGFWEEAGGWGVQVVVDVPEPLTRRRRKPTGLGASPRPAVPARPARPLGSQGSPR